MARIIDQKEVKVQLTEQTVKEMWDAIQETHKNEDPLPDCIVVSSEYGQIQFQIELEWRKNVQESLGYKKTKDIHYNMSSGLESHGLAVDKSKATKTKKLRSDPTIDLAARC